LASPESPREHRRGVLLLLLVTLIWGSTFVVIKGAVADVPPNGLMVLRFTLAGLVCLPLLRGGRRLSGQGRDHEGDEREAAAPGNAQAAAVHRNDPRSAPRLWRGGLALGFWLWAGYASQAVGLLYTTASRSAFITSFSVVLVPVLAGLAGHPVPRAIWGAAGLALVGIGLLSLDGAPPNVGDAWTLVTALAYAIYVLRLEHYATRSPPGPLAVAQLWGVLPFGLAGAAVALALSGNAYLGMTAGAIAAIPPAIWLAVLYLALVATALTTVLQTHGQRRVSAPEAMLIYAAEPVWAALFAYAVLGERLGARGWLGAALVLAATVLSQVRVMRRV